MLSLALAPICRCARRDLECGALESPKHGTEQTVPLLSRGYAWTIAAEPPTTPTDWLPCRLTVICSRSPGDDLEAGSIQPET
jgi:hypothetical protein